MEKKELNIQFEENEFEFLVNNSLSNSGELLRELLENSQATRKEIEKLSNLIQLKDNHIKDVEDKLSEIEIKLSIHKERSKLYKEKIQDKDDVIAALSIDSTSLKTKLDNCVDLLSTMKEQHQIADYQAIIKKKDEQIMELELKVKSKDVKLKNQYTLIKTHESKVEKLNENINKLSEIRIYAPYGFSEIKMHVPGIDPFIPTLDDKIAGKGWLVIHRRIDGKVSFNRSLDEYHKGFGDFGTDGELWLGLERIHKITTHQQHELYIHYVDYANESHKVTYGNFVVGSKDEDYALKSLGNFNGNTGDMMRVCLVNSKFKRNEIRANAFWYLLDSILQCNLTGLYSESCPNSYKYLHWGPGPGGEGVNNIKSVQMLIRPKEYSN